MKIQMLGVMFFTGGCLLLSGCSGSVTNSLTDQHASPSTTQTGSYVYVDVNNNGLEDGTQSKPFNTIQEGLNSVQEGGNLYIKAGTYNVSSALRVTKSINIVGDSNTNTIINANFSDYVFYLLKEGIKLSKLKINSPTGEGIFVKNPSVTTTITLRQIELYVDGCGVNINQPNANGLVILENSIIMTPDYGVWVQSGSHSIKNNLIKSSSYYAVYVSYYESSIYSSIENNIIFGSWAGIKSDYILLTTDYNNVWNNMINYSNVTAGSNSISADPKFVSSTDYHLQNGSPSVGMGPYYGSFPLN